VPARAWLDGLVLAAVAAVLARPPVVALTLARARLTRPEQGFIAWSGLKGAVPILLAALAVIEGVAGASQLYDVVFVVVLVSVAGQGTLVPYVARRLGIPMRDRLALPEAAARPRR
jgi:cell volume regulation protein A